MRTKTSRLTVLALGIVTMLGVGPGRAEEKGKPSEADIQQIAEEAYIYAFPMVMNYGTLYEYFIDKASPAYKAPINQLYNTARVQPEGHDHRHTQQRHTVLVRLHGPTG